MFPDPKELIPHREPFLFLDEVVACDATKIVATRTFRSDENFFEGHFPEQPVVPGVLLMEAMAQAMVYMHVYTHGPKLVYLAGIDDARFRSQVVPGDKVEFRVELLRFKLKVLQGRGTASVNGKVCVEATMRGFVTDPIEAPTA